MQVRGIVALLLTLSACGDDTPPNVISTEERARLEAALEARVSEARARCPATGAALRALGEPTGELAACIDRVRRARVTRRRLDREPVVIATALACGPLLDATVAAAASDDAACSPHALGERPPAEDLPFRSALFATELILERARQHAEAGEPARALAILADAARADQNLARGPVSLVRLMISMSTRTRLVDAALALLDARAPVDDAVVAKVDAAIAHEPSVIDALVADPDHVAVYMRPSSPDDVASVLAQTDEMRRALAAACPPPTATTTLRACHAALRSLPPPPAPRTRGFHHELLRSTIRALDDIEADRRDAVVTESRDLFAPLAADYVARAAEQLTALVAWRLALEVARTGRCPSTAAIASAPLAVLRSPPLLGDDVDVDVLGEAVEVRPPAWARPTSRPASSGSIRCP